MRRPIFHVIDGSLVVGLGLSVIGLGTVLSTLDEPGDVLRSRYAAVESGSGATSPGVMPAADPSVCRCVAALYDASESRGSTRLAPRRALANPSPQSGEMGNPGPRGEWDASRFLLDAAMAARRHPEVAFRASEIQTGQWVNDPTSIGSTSPPRGQPVTSASHRIGDAALGDWDHPSASPLRSSNSEITATFAAEGEPGSNS